MYQQPGGVFNLKFAFEINFTLNSNICLHVQAHDVSHAYHINKHDNMAIEHSIINT